MNIRKLIRISCDPTTLGVDCLDKDRDLRQANGAIEDLSPLRTLSYRKQNDKR